MIRSSRRLRIRHVTRYTYDRPVSRSVHRLHLKPITDFRQTVVSHKLSISQPTQVLEYDDVFGNVAARFELLTPYDELTITSESVVDVEDIDPFAFASTPIRPAFPLVWMPPERLMLNAYLQPDELPDTQLKEIYDYAMTFVEANKRDLMETLFAMNLSLHRDYQYAPGSTNLFTTAFDVYASKRGVCQDLSNLFITMARLLGIPARYICGYIHTGNTGENRIGADASHAWVQLYIPHVGWKGFDPTNGTLPHLDHVRVSYGRHFRDTAPTEGTLYSPANESMSVDVEVMEIERTSDMFPDVSTLRSPTSVSAPPAVAPTPPPVVTAPPVPQPPAGPQPISAPQSAVPEPLPYADHHVQTAATKAAPPVATV